MVDYSLQNKRTWGYNAFVARECRSAHEVSPIAKKLLTDKIKDVIKGITISDIVGTALGIAGLKPQ